jgi:hypothetical protein
MKNIRTFLFNAYVTGMLLFACSEVAMAKATLYDSTSLARLVIQTNELVQTMHASHQLWLLNQDRRLNELDLIIIRKTPLPGEPSYVEALEEKLRILESLRVDEESFQLQLLRLRYTKGLELIKLLYEKVLSLDHHFSSIQTFQQINTLSNPNSYPAFQQNRAIVEERLKKKGGGVRLPALFQSNPLLSATFSIVATLFSEGDNAQKEKEFDQIACIMDFTVRMNADLNTIYYETEFLKNNNQSLKDDCMALFTEYTKPINYLVQLDKCRKNDDWDAVMDAIDKTFKDISVNASDPVKSKVSMKQQVNLEFSMNRLLDYMDKYSVFVNEGEKYYRKFNVIVSNYQNETACAGQIPASFSDLKKDIDSSIDKFNNSYKLTELKGSKLKDLLYGLPEN